MATSYHPSDIQYVSDSSIQLQSLSYTNNNGHGQPSYQDSTHSHDNPHQNGHYGNGGSSSSPAVYSPGHPSADYEVVEAEEQEVGETPRLRTGPPKDFFGFALFVMVVFCSPIGLTAFQSARECRRAIYMRNMDIADAKSEEAKGRACLGLVTGLATWLVVAAFIVLGVLS